MATLGGRYLCGQSSHVFEFTEQKLAREIVDLYFSEHVRDDYRNFLFSEDMMRGVHTTFISDMLKKNYDKIIESSGGVDNPNARTIRFSMKDIFKPSMGVLKTDKVGQGISAWSADFNAICCPVMRYVSKIIQMIEQPHIITDAYISEIEFINRATKQFDMTTTTALNGVTDGEAFDANQNRFTQELERQFLGRLGLSETFIDFYYSCRNNYTIVGSAVRGKAASQKTSGEPGTLVNNGIVSKCISN